MRAYINMPNTNDNNLFLVYVIHVNQKNTKTKIIKIPANHEPDDNQSLRENGLVIASAKLFAKHLNLKINYLFSYD